MNIKQISIFLEDKPGTLYAVTELLTGNGVHIRAMTAMDMGGMTILRLLVDNIIYTASILKDAGYPATFTEVIVAEVKNSDNGLINVLESIKGAGVNIQHVYPIMSKNVRWIGQEIYMVFEVGNYAKAVEAMKAEGINILTQEELSSL